MNTVKGQVVSSKSVSLSKAARILSKFVSTDNEASPAFAAYLKRAMGSFNELVQLHKDCKNSRTQHKVKKSRSKSAVEGTVESVTNWGEVQNHSHSKNYDNGKASKSEKKNVDRKKKQDMGQIDSVEAAIHGAGVKNENSVDGSKEIKNKKKRDEFEEGKRDDHLDMKMEKKSHSNSQDGLSNQATHAGDEERKHKKNKKKNEMKDDEDEKDVKMENVDKGDDQKKHEKSQTHQVKERENEGKLEIETSNKDSRKRKCESFSTGKLDGSQEKHKSKKKKTRSE